MIKAQYKTNASNVAQRWMRRQKALRPALMTAADRAGKFVYGLARKYSSARDHSLADLAKMDHPYARRHGFGSGPHPDWVIHIQTKRRGQRFYDAWRYRVIGVFRGGIIVRVSNVAAHSIHMLGTRFMRPRPILQQVQKDAAAKSWRQTFPIIRAAMKKAA